MADTFSPNYSFILVEVGASRDTWGSKENENMVSIDAKLHDLQTQITTLGTADTTIRAEYKAWLPIGTILMWHTGSSGSVPAGWAICDGRVVAKSDGSGNITTPNLMGYFVRADPVSGTTGGSADFTGTATTTTAGSHDHGAKTGGTALTIAQLPAHTHDVGNTMRSGSRVTISGSGGIAEGSTTSTSTGSGLPHDHPISADGDHSHSVTLQIVPLYFTLIYIMRV